MITSTLSREQARDVDRRAIADYGMSSLVLMENAGRGCVDVMQKVGISGPVVVVCGKGNNGGDGFVIARHLDLRGFHVKVLLCCDPRQLEGDAASNYRILTYANVPIISACTSCSSRTLGENFRAVDWVVDALLGTGAKGEPQSPLDVLIDLMNAAPAKKLAVDLPSGMDCDTGHGSKHTFRADHTCTFVAVKLGFSAPCAQSWLGQLHVLDIGAPRKLIDEVLHRNEG